MLLGLFFLLTFRVIAQSSHVVKGYVHDALTQEPLPGTAVGVVATGKGTTTNDVGFFTLWLPSGPNKIIFSFLGYERQIDSLWLRQDTTLHIQLKPTVITTEEIVIQGESSEERVMQTVDRVSLQRQEIESLPYLLGEADPVKAIQYLPGVQSSGEGNTGFYVRGGGLDQNLILLDKAPVYNPSHLFGFFSVFNGSMLEDAELVRGGIPAYYGGRLSSILNITTRQGNKQQMKGQGGIGLIAANLQLEIPIVKNKSGLLVSGRRTYYDVLNRTFFSQHSPLKSGLDYYFQDFNVKWDYLFSDRNLIQISAYVGDDQFWYSNYDAFTNRIGWGNRVASALWKHVFSPRLFSEASLFYSEYQMNFEAEVSEYHLHLGSGIRDIGAQYELSYTPSDHHLMTMGLHLVRHRYLPNHIQATTQDTALDFGQAATLHTQEAALFWHDEWSLSEKWKTSLGMRTSYFQHLGPFQRYLSSQPGITSDTISYHPGERITHYARWEPRVAISYQLHKQSSLKVAFDRMYQYTHMAPMSSTTLPTDVWIPSSSVILPQKSTQYSLSYQHYTPDQDYEGTLTLYYKTMDHQMEYRDGVLIGYDKGLNFDDNFLFGKGTSYGTEFFLRKNKGVWRGWLSYTLSKTIRQFDDINQGTPFPAKYDRLHDLSLLANYQANPRWKFSGVFVFSTGNTMTLPVARYVMQGNVVNEYEGRNNYRLAPYHRLDLSVTYLTSLTGRYRSRWIFSVYNTYSRLNPYYIYFENEGNIREYELDVQAKQISLFPIIPALTYQFSF